ncbi:MAG: MBOAT family protein [Deltaproteobacteria bacterium]|nr:MBOAT family protein [Deltaproteobacteria bacterium]MBW2419030.1 MBOAT family protein [Deltaproteobacteria bacterium]
MLFNSFDFAFFLLVCLAVYYGLQLGAHCRAQNRVLLLASYVFYGAWDWRFLSLIAASTGVDYCVALALGRSDDPRRRRLLLGASLLTNLGILGFFKYANFFAENLQVLGASLGIELSRPLLEIVLPVGISFYTFQTLSYTIDVYRRRLEPTRDFFDFALFVAFFPQLVAGPIERAARLLPQIASPRRVDWQGFNSGSWLIFWGLFKKVVIADNLATLVDAVFNPASSPTSLELLLGIYAFAFQIYCDFSGYTDIARGVARLMGFDLMLNFRLPYFATSPADFWRRWHISLSTWLRDYLYVSLGGNRRGNRLRNRNLMITMLLGGLWHGAAWPFVLWGAFHGLLLVLHRLLQPWLEQVRPASVLGQGAWWVLRVLATFHLVCFGWLLFRSESLAQLATHLAILAGPVEAGFALSWLLPLAALMLPLLLVQIAQARSGNLEVPLGWSLPVRVATYAALFFIFVTLGEDGGQPFVYFQF